MKPVRIIALIAFLFAFSQGASAQYYSLGGDPAAISWRTLKGDHYNVVYPRGMDSLAREYLYNFELERYRTQVGLKIEGAKMPLVLHPYAIPGNATVVWAPRRVDIFTTPPFKSGYADTWIHQLAVHEGRHVGQTTHFTTGTFKVFRYILGEQGVGLGMGFYPTGWELEGDAVHSETDFSSTGRGRDANFLMPFRAMAVEGVTHSYDAYRFGSYRNFIPSKYAFGYMIETVLRDNGDYYVFGDIYKDYTRYWYDPSILNKAYQKYTGRTRRKNFRAAMAYFNNKFQQEYWMREPYTDFDYLSKYTNDRYTTYHSVLPADGVGTLAVKAGLRHYSQLVSIDSVGREHYIRPFATASLTSQLVNKDGNSFIWSEVVPHPRWELKNYSVLRSYDLSTHKMRTLTRRTRYFNPAYSPDGSIVSVTEYPVNGQPSRVVLLDSEKFKEIASIAAPDGGQIRYTAFLGDRIYADAVTGDGQWGLYSRPANDLNAEWEVEIAPQTRTLLRLTAAGNRLLLESDVEGVTNIYAYNPATRTIQKLTNSRFGAFTPYLDQEKGTLYYTEYNSTGYHPVKAARADLLWEDASFEKPYVYEEAERFKALSDSCAPALSPAGQTALRAKVDSLPSKRYIKPLNIINIHSWAPFYAGVRRIMDMSYDHYYQLASPGITLISQNQLSTAELIMGYSYHGGRHAGHLNFNYTGLWPMFEINVDYNDRPRYRIRYEEYAGPVDTVSIEKPTLDISAAVYTKINLSRGGWQSAIIPRIEATWNQDLYYGGGDVLLPGKDIQASVRYYTMLPKTTYNRMPRLGIGAEVKGAYLMGPFSGDAKALYGYVYGYLPGFTLDQGFKFTASGQKRFDSVGAGELMKNLASLPRGYRNIPLNDYYKVTADYVIPIALNDWQPIDLLYFMRVNITPFADYAVNRTAAGDLQRLMSYGSVFTIQGHLFRIGLKMELGTRISRYRELDGTWRMRYDFVSGINL